MKLSDKIIERVRQLMRTAGIMSDIQKILAEEKVKGIVVEFHGRSTYRIDDEDIIKAVQSAAIDEAGRVSKRVGEEFASMFVKDEGQEELTDLSGMGRDSGTHNNPPSKLSITDIVDFIEKRVRKLEQDREGVIPSVRAFITRAIEEHAKVLEYISKHIV